MSRTSNNNSSSITNNNKYYYNNSMPSIQYRTIKVVTAIVHGCCSKLLSTTCSESSLTSKTLATSKLNYSSGSIALFATIIDDVACCNNTIISLSTVCTALKAIIYNLLTYLSTYLSISLEERPRPSILRSCSYPSRYGCCGSNHGLSVVATTAIAPSIPPLLLLPPATMLLLPIITSSMMTAGSPMSLVTCTSIALFSAAI